MNIRLERQHAENQVLKDQHNFGKKELGSRVVTHVFVLKRKENLSSLVVHGQCLRILDIMSRG